MKLTAIQQAQIDAVNDERERCASIVRETIDAANQEGAHDIVAWLYGVLGEITSKHNN